MRKLFRACFILVLLTGLGSTYAQLITYTMQDTLVTSCDGILTDSDAGFTAGNYGHNENFTFTICPFGTVNNISLLWSSFSTEINLDRLRIFAGADTNGTLIGGPYSGNNLPPTLSFSGCITINFISDGSVAGPGWLATWNATLDPPVPTTITRTPAIVTCSTSTLQLTLGDRFHCDSLTASHFSITGIAPQLVQATPVGCVNDSTDRVNLTLLPGANLDGTYFLDYNYWFRDACDSLWNITSSDTFTVNDCPLTLQVTTTQDTICEGECVDLEAFANGGDSLTYQYNWTPVLPNNAGPHTVCPMTTTTYSLTVSDASPAQPATDQVTVVVLPAPNITAPAPICQSASPFNMTATPGGGTWRGNGIIDSTLGRFDPPTAGAGVHMVYYISPNGCTDSVQVTVTQIDAGPSQSACPGSAPFNMTGFSPAGGVWSGTPLISPAGVFNPSAGGIYNVTYTQGGCSDTKLVFVQPITLPPDTLLCASADTFTIQPMPPGGTWSGSPGVSANGFFRPSAADTGLNVLTYTINGCNAVMNITVTDIDARPNQFTCPKSAPFNVLQGMPAGGYWTGPGIIDSLTGLFDPNITGGNYNALLTYHISGCTDQKYVWVRITDVAPDTIQFCPTDPVFTLNYANTTRNSVPGLWSGNGITGGGTTGYFTPSVAGPGFHGMYYTAHGCTDSIVAYVIPPKSLTDTSVCDLSSAFQLNEYPADPQPGGIWTGPGITDPHGTFDPQATGVGTFELYYDNFYGCQDTTSVTVLPLDTITLAGLDGSYCYGDTNIALTISPPGGVFTGTGILVNDSTFNPVVAGPGLHVFTYTTGVGACQQSKQIATTVRPPIQINTAISDDSICLGETTQLSVASSGGLGQFTYAWDNGLPPSLQHTVAPTATTVYIVTVEDGCSEPAADTLTVTVNQPFSIDFDTSAQLCYGDTGFAVVLPSISGNFTYIWDTDPPQFGDTVWAPVTSDYNVIVTNLNSDCDVSGTVTIPGYSSINANFIKNPNQCVMIDDPEFSFIDLSVGATMGIWDFGDGTVEPFNPGINPIHLYSEVGTFNVTLDIENDGGCPSSFNLDVCIEPVPVRVYNTFTPNNDGVNDFFEIEGLEIYPNHKLTIYNRYGNVVWEGNEYQNTWDGTNYKSGQPLADGAYFYILDLGDLEKENEVGDVVIMR